MYSAQITRANPTCIVLLIDQSASISDPFSGDSARKKCEVVAEVVNHTLHDLVIRCTKTEEVRNYYHIAVLGYGARYGRALVDHSRRARSCRSLTLPIIRCRSKTVTSASPTARPAGSRSRCVFPFGFIPPLTARRQCAKR